jgi:hypothetical protein
MTVPTGLTVVGMTALLCWLGYRLLLRHGQQLLDRDALENQLNNSDTEFQRGITKATSSRVPVAAQRAAYHRMQDEAIRAAGAYPVERFSGRGIVIVAGGIRYFTCAWVCITLLRRVLGCTLPVEVWYRGRDEMSHEMIELLRPFGVKCIDLCEVQRRYPVRYLGGYESKPYAILHSSFQEVILLDADNVPLIDPSELLDHPEYQRTGAIFWPDIRSLARDSPIWQICRVPYRPEPEFESGQIVIDKERCWTALHLTMHMNEWSDFYYQYVRGDKDTFHMAWRMLQLPYSMTSYSAHPIIGRFGESDRYVSVVLEQHDFDGHAIFQHRCGGAKWNAWGRRFTPLTGQSGWLQYEEECRQALDELRRRWSGRVTPPPAPGRRAATEGEIIHTRRFLYCRVGADQRVLEFLPDHRLQMIPARPGSEHEQAWRLQDRGAEKSLMIEGTFGVTCRLVLDVDGRWRGTWLDYEQMPVELIPLAPSE